MKSSSSLFFGLISALGLINSCSAKQEFQCDTRLFSAADTALEKVRNWEDVHRWYVKFGICDDGYLSEGLSDTIGGLMIQNWSKIGEFAATAHRNPQFLAFVLKHVNSTLDSQALGSIRENALNHCPEGYSDTCRKIGNSADQALNSSQ
ncbi:MAG TPA: hypothetical protein VFX23_00415 [Limnobacter sp.]|nr:hypothetical protein [Limnobacter sp.]